MANIGPKATRSLRVPTPHLNVHQLVDVRRARKQIQEAHRMCDQKSFLKTEDSLHPALQTVDSAKTCMRHLKIQLMISSFLRPTDSGAKIQQQDSERDAVYNIEWNDNERQIDVAVLHLYDNCSFQNPSFCLILIIHVLSLFNF